MRNTADLARGAEEFGYHRYWFAAHHLNPGVAGASPPVLIAPVAAATERIRLAHRTPPAVVEEFGLLEALHPGRLDLGLGRSGKQLVREHATAAATVAAPCGSCRRRPARTSSSSRPSPTPHADRVRSCELLAEHWNR